MDERLNQIDALFAEWDRPDSPGCALGIVEDGRLVYGRGYGSANLEYQIPITTQTVFDIASTSKQFTAACIALLIERGQLRLDDPMSAHVPECAAFLKDSVTIAHLLHHTSGWRDYLTLFELAGYRRADYDTKEVMGMLERQRGVNNTPGKAYLYSDTNYFLLGLIVERVAEQTLAAFAEEHIFRPLGMSNTRFQDDHTQIVPRRATGYSLREVGGYRIDMTTLDIVGDGALLTCVDDLALWAVNFEDNRLGNGGRSLIDLLHTRGRLNNGEQISYAFGLVTDRYRGLDTVSHGGDWVGYRSEILRFPAQHTAILCLANLSSIDPEALALRVADVWLGNIFTEEVPPPVTEAKAKISRAANLSLGEYIGEYACEELNTVYHLTLEGEQLVVRFGRIGPLPLVASTSDIFQLADKTLHFAKNEAGTVSSFVLNDPRARGLWFKRLTEIGD
jgi:CubicO group peptidase (beta-lactamase class C family)